MHHLLLSIFLLGMLLRSPGNMTAQENIRISDSLEFHAEILEVNIDYPLGKNLKFSMGNYTIIVDNELSSTDSYKNEPFQGFIVDKTIKTVSLTISDSLNKSVVILEDKDRVNSFYPNETVENFFLDQINGKKHGKVKAWITMSGDSSETWALLAIKGKGDEWTPPVEMHLTCRDKKIKLVNVSSNAHFNDSNPYRNRKKIPALGIEFFQDGKSVCAIQYDSGTPNDFNMGPRQSFGCKAWMLPDLDTSTKLMLAAAMSTLMLSNNPYLRLQD